MIVTLASFKGGVAKSTSAVHIAYELSRHAKTLLVDGDPNRSSSRWTARGHQMPFPICDEAEAVKYTRSETYEHIVIDTKARPEPSDLKALAKGCELLILPCTPDDLSIDAMLGTVDAIRFPGAAPFRVLLTIVPPRPNLDGMKARAALSAAGIPLFKTQIARAAAYQRCMVSGQVVNTPEYGEVVQEVLALAAQTSETPAVQKSEPPKIRLYDAPLVYKPTHPDNRISR